MEISYKFRIYPTPEQEAMIQENFKAAMFVYNYFLEMRIEKYQQSGEGMSYYDCTKALTELKRQPDALWLNRTDSTALQAAAQDLDAAYSNFFRRMKAGEKALGFPAFKHGDDPKQSYRSKNNSRRRGIRLEGDTSIRLPKLGSVQCRVSRPVQGRILSATVSRRPSGKYYVALCCRLEEELPPLPPTGAVVGIYLGLDGLGSTSDGEALVVPRPETKDVEKLRKLQKKLFRQQKGSNRYKETQRKIAVVREHITAQRVDAFHKMTSELVKKYDTIYLQEMPARRTPHNMETYHALTVADTAWTEFRRQLEYKAQWYGKKVVVLDGDLDLTAGGGDSEAAASILKEGLRTSGQ